MGKSWHPSDGHSVPNREMASIHWIIIVYFVQNETDKETFTEEAQDDCTRFLTVNWGIYRGPDLIMDGGDFEKPVIWPNRVWRRYFQNVQPV